MRIYVVDNGRSIFSVEVVKETPKCYIVDPATKKEHWQKSWCIGNRIWKEKDRWFETLVEAVDHLVTSHTGSVTHLQSELAEAQERLNRLLKARETFEETERQVTAP
jgi:hypothetical protein